MRLAGLGNRRPLPNVMTSTRHLGGKLPAGFEHRVVTDKSGILPRDHRGRRPGFSIRPWAPTTPRRVANRDGNAAFAVLEQRVL